MRSHILQLLGCICEFEMLHAYLMLWGLKITDLAGCVQADMGSVILPEVNSFIAGEKRKKTNFSSWKQPATIASRPAGADYRYADDEAVLQPQRHLDGGGFPAHQWLSSKPVALLTCSCEEGGQPCCCLHLAELG